MATPQWIQDIPKTVKQLAVIAATVGALVTATAAWVARGTVGQVKTNTADIGMVWDSVSGLSEDVSETRCMVRGLVLDDEDPRDCIFADDGR